MFGNLIQLHMHQTLELFGETLIIAKVCVWDRRKRIVLESNIAYILFSHCKFIKQELLLTNNLIKKDEKRRSCKCNLKLAWIASAIEM